MKTPLQAAVLLVVSLGCIVVGILALSAGGGYLAGQEERQVAATQTQTSEISLQYDLAVSDIQAERYALALQRVQWILTLDPDYPGASELLSEIARRQNQAGVPVITPSTPEAQATALPPAEELSPEELYAEAETLFNRQQWEGAITRLRELRALAPDYRRPDVDDMLWEAQQTLGLTYVRGDRLEEGIVLLEAAEEIRPLDNLAGGELVYARLYVNGRGYWELNWPLVIQNFAELYRVAPNYRDVASRLRTAYVEQSDYLADIGEYCAAASNMQQAVAIEGSAESQARLTELEEFCANPPTPTGGPQETPTPENPTPTSESPTSEPPPETPTLTPEP